MATATILKSTRIRLPADSVTLDRKKSKWRNKITVMGGRKFDSRKEANRFNELEAMEKTGLIRELRLQVRIPITVNRVKICTYIADFAYNVVSTGERVFEDVKSPATRKIPVYRIKFKLLKACGIRVTEV